MEDQKVSDKRKAPDKSMSEEDISLTVQTPNKKARLDLPPDDAVLSPTTKEQESTHMVSYNNYPHTDRNESVTTEPLSLMDTSQSIPLDSKQTNNTPPLVENGEKSDVEMNSAVVEGDEKKPLEAVDGIDDGPVVQHTEDNNNEEESNKKAVSPEEENVEKVKSNHQPIASSSPSSEPETNSGSSPSEGVEIQIRAYDLKSRRLIYDEPTLKSDYGRLESFLKSHNVYLSQSSLGGYMGDVSSQDHSLPLGGSSHYPGYRNRSRWTSSTLGSVIPRESMKTIHTISPNDSPDEPSKNESSTTKKRGRNGPKMTSTKIGDLSSNSFAKPEKVNTSTGMNGDSSPSGKTKSPSNTKLAGNKSKNAAPTITPNQVSTSPTTASKATSVKSKKLNKSTPTGPGRRSLDEKSDSVGVSAKKKGGSRTLSREFSGVRMDSPLLSVSSPLPVDPSPVRIIAKVEGTVAKPMTKFEIEVNNEPVVVDDLSRSATLWGSISPNELVFARWRDRSYYSGVVKAKGLNDTWVIDYDDGMEDVASETHIVPIKIIGVNTQGVYSPDGCFKPSVATVLGQKFVNDPEVGQTVKYAIQLKGEEKPIWCTRRQLSIKENDARILRQEFEPTPKIFKAAEVNLENIVSGTRRRVNTSTPAGKTVGGAFDVSVAEDSPKSVVKKRAAKVSRKVSDSSGVSDVSKISSVDVSLNSKATEIVEKEKSKSDKSVKESPKKSKSKETLLFEGFQFFLTASGGGDPANESDSPIPVIPYDKDEYRELIETQGGKVIDQVGKEKGREKVFLVSDNYARTVKYIYCLAATIPCVSHKWIQKCLDEGTIVNYKPFELNSGYSLEENKVIPSHSLKPLKGTKIFITAGTDDLYNYWKPVLTAAQATLIKPKKVKGKIVPGIPDGSEALVTDATCAPEVLNAAHETMIPVVKPEWLVQTIICGKKVDFFGHEKYRVDIDPDEEEEEENDENAEVDA